MSDEDKLRYLELLQYELALLEAEDDLVRFSEVTMPNPRFLNDPQKSAYIAAKHHRYMADVMMQIERGELTKVILNAPPRHGKSELCTRRFAAWFSARNPSKDIIIATYNDDFAQNFGKDVRDIMASPRFRQIFPEYHLKSQSNEHVRTYQNGDIFFLGRRSSTTGRGADLIIVDDPTKDDKDVKYDTFREDCWQWFTQTLLTRRHNDRAAIAVTQTRWHEDDIVGRLTDPANPAFAPRLSRGFKLINLPAIAIDDDPIGRAPGDALWPERFGLKYLEEMKDANNTAFAALYQCDPTPEDGVYYHAEDIYEYDEDELPSALRKYAVSDHAVGTKAVNDPSCLVPYGVDEEGTAWVLPSVVWRRMDAQEAVEEMVAMMKAQKPDYWYAEKGHISKSIGPFLKKRMVEEGVYVPIIEDHPTADKIQRAHSARARAAQGKIKFPKFAPWWPKAKSELLKFPNGRFDDFVDCVSMIGMRVMDNHGMRKRKAPTRFEPGTMGHLLEQFKRQDAEDAASKARAGW